MYSHEHVLTYTCTRRKKFTQSIIIAMHAFIWVKAVPTLQASITLLELQLVAFRRTPQGTGHTISMAFQMDV